ncbi:MAG: hypothetical protein JNK21_09460, partial [Rhodospirillaceae bacterium]|nr:hypothetical protein [Rhodospirillaceae bacterium]
YGLDGSEDVARLFDRFLDTDARKPVVMCHPGDCADEAGSIHRARANEYAFLKSQTFADLLARHDFALKRFADL